MSSFHAIVWLDRSEAHVIQFDRSQVQSQTIVSNNSKKFKPSGGHTGSHNGRHGRGESASSHHATDVGHASSIEDFYHEVARQLEGVQEVLVTGPAQAKDEFCAHCRRHDKDIDHAIVGMFPSDHPSEGQLLALARQFFLKHDRMQGDALSQRAARH